MHKMIETVTERVRKRSAHSRQKYLQKCTGMRAQGPNRNQLSCSNLAHGFAACESGDKDIIRLTESANIGIVTAYNDMLSAHQPYHNYPDIIKQALREMGCTAQVAGGVPAMCDGVTQGTAGMELSLFSRDVIAMATAIALSHNMFDGALYLGICDKIVPGLLIGALGFGHLPTIFVPGGPMSSGISNAEKAATRQRFADGKASKEELLDSEARAYHGAGTCTFYGTANSNQMLMEAMGLHLPGSAFVNPGDDLRRALTEASARRVAQMTALGKSYLPLCDIADEKSFINAIVTLLATGGSTNHAIHWIAAAAAAGIKLDWTDFDQLSSVTPLLCRIYPNGSADINRFSEVGGTGFVLRELLDAGLLHEDVKTVSGGTLRDYTQTPELTDQGGVRWQPASAITADDTVLRPASAAFSSHGGLSLLSGNLGRAVIKVSAVASEHHCIKAPCRVFEDQDDVATAYHAGELEHDVIVVVKGQGPVANGMPELHKLTPFLANLMGRGFKTALVTDGRMSGASGKVPAAIHLCPEAATGGPIGKLRDGDVIELNATLGTLVALVDDAEWVARQCIYHAHHNHDTGRELFASFRAVVGQAETGASVFGDFGYNAP